MDLKDIIKLQFVSGMAQSQTYSGGQANEGGHTSTFDKIFNIACQALLMLAIGFADEISKQIPVVLEYIKQRFMAKFNADSITQTLDCMRQVPISENAVPLTRRHFNNRVSMSRTYDVDTKNKNTERLEKKNEMVDSILRIVARQENVPSFRLIDSAQMMINYRDTPIQLTSDIYLKLEKVDVSPEGSVGSIDITLCSNTVSAAEISKYIQHTHRLFREELRNALGDVVYYFDQKSRDSVPNMPAGPNPSDQEITNHKQMMIKTAPKSLTFTKCPFVSNKQFSNIFGDNVREIEKRVKFFIERKSWYDSRGIPYQLGLMMSGAPGCGKTSIIRAVANYTKRHIINVNFANITTATQLKNLFQSEKLSVYTDSSMAEVVHYHVPIDQRIYVLEEIDTIGSIVRQRTAASTAQHTVSDELTLGEILTVLDGTMETPGRIVIMTSNHPDLLDAALVRPGRIDVMVKFEKASAGAISEMYSAFFDHDLSSGQIERLPDRRLTPAEISQILFRHFDDEITDRDERLIKDLIDSADRIENYNKQRNDNLLRLEKERTDGERKRLKERSIKSLKNKKSSRSSSKVSFTDPAESQLESRHISKDSNGPSKDNSKIVISDSSETFTEDSSNEEEDTKTQSFQSHGSTPISDNQQWPTNKLNEYIKSNDKLPPGFSNQENLMKNSPWLDPGHQDHSPNNWNYKEGQRLGHNAEANVPAALNEHCGENLDSMFAPLSNGITVGYSY